MGDTIYAMLNDVQTDVAQYPQTPMTPQQKRSILQNDMLKQQLFGGEAPEKRRKQNWVKKVLVPAACVALAVSTSLVGAASFATTSTLAHSVAEFFGFNDSLEPYTTVINQPTTKAGVTLNLQAVIYDRVNNMLILSTTVSTQDAPIEEDTIWSPHIRPYINGKRIETAQLVQSAAIDEHTMGFTHRVLLDEAYYGDMDIHIRYAGVDVNGEYIKKTWEYTFATNGEQLAQNTLYRDIGLDFDLGGESITLSHLSDNPISTGIFYTVDTLLFDKDMKIEGVDNLGNPVGFELIYKEAGQGGIFAIDPAQYQITEQVTTLTLTLYVRTSQEGRETTPYQVVGEPFVVHLTYDCFLIGTL